MKTIALVALCTGIAAALAAIVLQAVKIHRAGKSDKYAIRMIVFAGIFIAVAIVNIILIYPYL